MNAGVSTRYIIKDNNLTGNVNATGLSDAGTGAAIVKDNIAYNPVGVSAITVTASPFTYTAGHAPESIYITGGTVSVVAIGGTTIYTATEKTVELGPNESVVLTYSVLPAMNKSVH